MSEPPPIDHVACLRCGYDLYNLPLDGTCPECGTPISRTLDGNLLRFSPPQYLKSLSDGVLLIVLSYLITLLGIVMMIPVAVAVGFTAATQGTAPTWITVMEIVSSVFYFGVGVLSLIGWWKFSAPDPNFIGTDTAHGYRQALRLIVALYATILAISLPLSVMQAVTESDVYEAGSFVVGLFSFLLGVAMFFVSLLYVRIVAIRIPNRDLVQRSAMYLWLLPVIYILGALCLALGPLIATVMYLFLLWRVRKEIIAIHKHVTAGGGDLATP